MQITAKNRLFPFIVLMMVKPVTDMRVLNHNLQGQM